MRPKLKTFLLSVLCLGLIFGSLFIFKKAPSIASYSYYEPITIDPSSLNGNSVWGGGETFETVIASGGFDSKAAFYSATNKSAGGLEPSGALSLNGVPYQLSWTGASDYTGNDSIKLYSIHESSTITLDTVGAYETLHILGTASGLSEEDYASISVVVHYTDGTYDEISHRLYDWRDSTPISGYYKWPDVMTRSLAGTYDYEGSTTGAPFLQSATVSADSKKLISSIDFILTGHNGDTSTSDIYCSIFAVTGMVNASAPAPVESVRVNETTETGANVQWQTTIGATSYRLDIASDSGFKQILPDYNNLYTQDTSVVIVGLNGNTTYYIRVRAENAEGQSVSSDVVNFTTDPETIPPTIAIAANPNLIQIQDEATIIGTDASGIKSIDESLDGGSTWNQISDADHISRTITENGTYCYRATDNYDNISDSVCVTYTNLDTAKPVISVNTNGYTEGEWTSDIISLSVDSLTTNAGQTKYYYSVDSTNWLPYNGAVIVNEETSEDGKQYYFKAISQAGVESDIVSTTVRRDITAPTGEITSSNNGWNQFLNTLTFGLFFNETKNFDIYATDVLSGINHTEYLISNTAFDSEESALSADGWNLTSGPVTVNPEKELIIYFKIVDNAGNVSIINTDGIVLDATKALISGYVDAGRTFPLEDGNTYYLVRKLLVTDNRALGSITVNGEPVAIQDNNIIELNPDHIYNIVATDKANNVTSLTIKTGSLVDYDLNVTDDNYKTSDQSSLSNSVAELLRIKDSEGDHATTDELKTITDLVVRANELLQRIAELKSKLSSINESATTIPDIEHATSADHETIQDIIETINTLIDSDGVRLSIEDINTLLSQKHELSDKLLRLGSIAEDLHAIDIVNHTDVDIIKTEDKAELEALKATTEALLAGDNLEADERAETETILSQIHELLARINEAVAAKETTAVHEAHRIISTGYSTDDKDTLTSAKADLEAAIYRFSNNYTDAEKQALNSQLSSIDSAISDIDNQIWEETRRTTFPTITVTDKTQKWTAIDTVGVSATDEYGIDTLEVSSDGGQTWELISTYDSSTADITKNGTYLFRATNEFGNTATESVVYHNIDSVAPIVSVNTHGYTPGSWTNHPVVLSAESVAENVGPVALYYRAVSTVDGENDWLPYTSNIVIADDTASKVFEFKAISSAGIESAIERIEVKKDSIVPTGTISTGTNTVSSVLHTLTFGLLFDETKTYKLSAEDEHSGVKTIEYIVSDSELTNEELTDSTSWQITNGTVSVDPDKSTNVYYCITDYANNISIVTLSGIVFNLPGITNADITISNTDIDGTAVATSSGTITLVSDLEHATSEDLGALNSIKSELTSYLGNHPEDNSGIVDSVIADYAHTIEKIEGVETSLTTIRNNFDTVESIDFITSSSKERILGLVTDITSLAQSASNHLTNTEYQELNNKLDALNSKLARIGEIQAELEAISNEMSTYSIDSVTKEDLASLSSLKSRINWLLGSANVTASEKEQLREYLNTIAELENRIAEAEKALEEAKENDHTNGINPNNVTPDDQTSLEDAARAYAEALGVFDSNLSLADLFDINNRITIINSALDILDQVAEFEAMISRLPNPEDVDYDSRLLIKAAESAYNALSEYGRSLVGPSLLARYRAVLESYRAYLEGSPLLYAFETLDIFWWSISTFAIIGIFIFIVRHTHRRYTEASDSDDF